MALCRRTIGGDRHRYAIAGPGKLGTDPVAVDGIDGRRYLSLMEEEEPVSKISNQVQR